MHRRNLAFVTVEFLKACFMYLRRPLSASQKLQSISEEELLKSSNRLASLDQVRPGTLEPAPFKGMVKESLMKLYFCCNLKTSLYIRSLCPVAY